jgi:AcrR family transcriptional regulator
MRARRDAGAYHSVCAQCHDRAVFRAPAKSFLDLMARDAIYAALSAGPMKKRAAAGPQSAARTRLVGDTPVSYNLRMAETKHTAPAVSPARPAVRRRQAIRSALSDRRLTEAAIELLVQSGVQGTTLQAVGERAGYSRALATHRYGSKAGLFGQVLKVATADWLERMHKAVGKRTGAEALCAATDATYQFIRERPNEVRAMYLLWFHSIDPGAVYRSNLANAHRAQRRDVAAWVKAGQEKGEVDRSVKRHRLAEQYTATMAGIAYQWLANADVPLGAMYRQLKADIRARLKTRGARRASASNT